MIGSEVVRTDHAPGSCFDAFSSRELVSTSLENALINARPWLTLPWTFPHKRANREPAIGSRY
jgi:hypothetical protein